MQRRQFLAAAATAAASTALGSLSGCGRLGASSGALTKQMLERTRGMNVVFINIEDTNPIGLSCYGHPMARTPNLDRLAASGMRFTQAHAQFALCTPSRCSYLSGTNPWTNSAIHNTQIFHQTVPPGTTSLPEVFSQYGYYMGNYGKLFHHATEPYRVFDELNFCAKPLPPGQEPPKPTWTEKEGKDYALQANRLGDSGLTRTETVEYFICNDASKMIARQARNARPFFLSVGSCLPHAPWICPKEYVDRFPPEKMDLAAPTAAQLRGVPPVAVRNHCNFDIYPDIQPTGDQIRQARAAYFACVHFVDEQIGMVLDELDRQGIADRTIVVFFADHGMHLGEHGLFGKVTLFGESTRVPLIIRVPGMPNAGQTCDQLVELIDVMPTLCELTGASTPPLVQGRSLVPLLTNPGRPIRDAVFSMATLDQEGAPIGHSIRTGTLRYSVWQTRTDPMGWAPPNQTFYSLYDLQADPLETTNQIDNPKFTQTIRQLHARLDKEMGGLPGPPYPPGQDPQGPGPVR